MRTNYITTGAMLLALAVPVGARAAAAPEPHVALLAEHGIMPTAESIGEYLRWLHPDGDAQKEIATLIRQLGDDDFFRREEAMKRLMRMPVGSVELLQKAIDEGDPEVQWRARQVIERADNRSAEILFAAFKTVRTQKLKGLTERILATVPLCREQYLRRAAVEALKVTASTEDAAMFRRELAGKNDHVRMAAADVLEGLLAAQADDDLRPLLKDKNDEVAVLAARLMANHGTADCLPALGRLLRSETLGVRVKAVKTLRAATGQNFGYLAYAEERTETLAKWEKWLTAEGKTAKLKHPLKDSAFELGYTLVCCYSQNKVYQFDAAGKTVWEIAAAKHPWGCQGLPNGHRLICMYSGKSVVEYDASGKQVWQTAGLSGGPMSVRRLENGNTLIACTDSHQVVEADRSGKIVWTITLSGRPTDARRLENGRTLVTLQNGRRVVEADRAGKVQWEITGLNNPISAQRLENGNTLIALIGGGSVAEYDPSGKQVWSKTGYRNPYYVQRLSNGNTLITDAGGVTEIDHSGKKIWHKAMTGVSKAHRY